MLKVFLQGHEFGIGGGGVANHYFSSRLSKNSRAAAEQNSSCQLCLKIIQKVPFYNIASQAIFEFSRLKCRFLARKNNDSLRTNIARFARIFVEK